MTKGRCCDAGEGGDEERLPLERLRDSSSAADRLQRAATHALGGPRPTLEPRYVSKDSLCCRFQRFLSPDPNSAVAGRRDRGEG